MAYSLFADLQSIFLLILLGFDHVKLQRLRFKSYSANSWKD